MRTLVIQGFGVANGALVVDDERLIGGEDLVLADVAELGRAIPIGRLDAHYLLVEATLVHGADVGWLKKLWRVLVDINHGNVNGGAGIISRYITRYYRVLQDYLFCGDEIS